MMRPVIRVMVMPNETNFAPLGVLGYCLTRTNFLWPFLTAVHLPLKAVDHTPASKLLDVLVSILAGCRAISQVNTRLRPDTALARAWGRTQFADQSTLARTLDRFRDEQVQQLRASSLALSQAQKACTVLRSDGGFGSDANVNSALLNHWQVLTKSSGGRRPAALARQVEIQAWSPREVIAHYDARGTCETEIQADKGGLLLARRRKKVLAAQEALVLLTDL